MAEEDERAIISPKQSLGSKKTNRGGGQSLNIVSESGLYVLIIRSNLPEAKAPLGGGVLHHQDHRRDVLKLKEYEAFRLMDKEHQKEAIRKLSESLRSPLCATYLRW
jgi:hypothetical protein